MNIILLSMPAAGKGTQADMLSLEYGMDHISLGEVFRNEIHNQTELGLRVKKIMEDGFLVEEAIVEELLFNKLNTTTNNYILDGFPRNLDQALVYDEYIKNKNQPYLVLYLEVDLETAHKRITGRLVCSNCNDSYNIYGNKPIVDSICNTCGSNLIKREDDSEEHFNNRYMVFMTETKPVIDYYKLHNKLITINANQSKQLIFAEIKRSIGDYFDKH